MILLVLLALGAITEAPPSPTTSIVIPILVAALSGAGSGLVAIWYRNQKYGSQERDEIVARATKQVVEGAELLLEQYRTDLATARLAIEALELKLEEANKKITELGIALAESRGDRNRLSHELADAMERRGAMKAEMESLRSRVNELEAAVSAPD